MQEEIWVKIPLFEDYEVSSMGRICNVDSGRIIGVSNWKHKYATARIRNKSGVKTVSTHRIVAENFISNPENKPQVNHINGIKSDNRIDNLEWVSVSENIKHAWDNNFYKGFRSGKRVSGTCLKTGLVKEYNRIVDVVSDGFQACNVSMVCNGVYKQHKGYSWEYL